MNEIAHNHVRRPKHSVRRPLSAMSFLLCVGIAVAVFVLGTDFFREQAISHPDQIDGALLLVVFLVGGLMVGSWLFVDQGGSHNVKWYLVGAALVAAAIVGVQDGKDSNGDRPAPSHFREAEPIPNRR